MLCKYCGKEVPLNNGYASYCSTNCYQKWRYKNVVGVKERQMETAKIRRKIRYATDENFRKKSIFYSQQWQRRHPEQQCRNVLKYQAKKKEALKNERTIA